MQTISTEWNDRIMSYYMLITTAEQEMQKRIGIAEHLIGIEKITDKELLNELLNYKPKEMKKFVNRFAVSGTPLDLMLFEKHLLNLGYTLANGEDYFNYRSPTGEPGQYITIGLHRGCEATGTYIVAMNAGGCEIDEEFNLRNQVHKTQAYRWAAETETPIHISEDGVELYGNETVYCARENDNAVGTIAPKITARFIKDLLTFDWKIFSTEKARDEWVAKVYKARQDKLENEKIYSRKDVKEIIDNILNPKELFDSPKRIFDSIWANMTNVKENKK